MTLVQILRRFLDELWVHGNEAYALEYFQGIATGLWPGEVGPEGYLQHYRALSRVLKEVRFEFTNWQQDGDKLWVSWIRLGRPWKSPEREVRWPGAANLRFQDGKILEFHTYQDYMALFSQLELLPEQIFEHSLASVNLIETPKPGAAPSRRETQYLWPGFQKLSSEERDFYIPCTPRQLSRLSKGAEFLLPTAEQLEVLSDFGSFSLVVVDEADRILEADDTFARLTDRITESLPGLVFRKLLFPEDQPREQALFNELVEESRTQYHHSARIMRGSDLLWVDVSAAIILFRAGDSQIVRAIQKTSRIDDVVAFQETERKVLSMELHDGLAQDLATLWVHLQTGKHAPSPWPGLMKRCLQLVENMSEELRRSMKDLKSPILEGASLYTGLKNLAVRTQREGKVLVSLLAKESDLDLLDETIAFLIYRVVQEALRNVVEHSKAELCEVEIRRHGDRVFGTIEDNGEGFDPVEVASKGRLGLLGMRDRCEMAGGYLEVVSSKGQGTTLSFEMQAGKSFLGRSV